MDCSTLDSLRSHRTRITLCSTLGTLRWTRTAPCSTLSARCCTRITPCSTLSASYWGLSLEPFAQAQGRSAMHPMERGSRPSASLRLAGLQTHRLAHIHAPKQPHTPPPNQPPTHSPFGVCVRVGGGGGRRVLRGSCCVRVCEWVFLPLFLFSFVWATGQ